MRQRRAGELRGPRASDGRLEGLRARLRHGPDGIRKYAKRQSLMITPGYAASREAHMFPYSAAVTEPIGQTVSALAASDLFTDAQRQTLSVLCDTFVPSLEPPEGEADPTGSGRAPPRTSGSPRRSRSAAPGERAGGADRGPAPAPGLAGWEGMVAETPPPTGRRSSTRSPTRARRPGRDHRDPGADDEPSLRAAGPRDRPQPELGRDRLPGAAAPPRPTSRSRFNPSTEPPAR